MQNSPFRLEQPKRKREYHLDNTTLEVVGEEKDQGVINDQLGFHNHIATAVTKTNHMLERIK